MRILICNERFLFRFGVDRVLLILGYFWKKKGHEIIMMGNHLDEQAVGKCSDRFIQIPEAKDYLHGNEYTRRYVEQHWDQWFIDGNKPDLALIAGWPFYQSIGYLKQQCGIAIFHDYGAVPMDGMNTAQKTVQEELRRLRYENLREADQVIAISRFLEESQSIPDVEKTIPTTYVHLGVDHLDMNLWNKEDVSASQKDVLGDIRKFKQDGWKLIMQPGRWESGNYKNSAASFDIVRKLVRQGLKVKVLLLATLDQIDEIPPELQDAYYGMGYIDDATMRAVMEQVELGFSPTLWEGFDLPLGEMQFLNKCMYVFQTGAHSEVVANPYFLCKDQEEMAEKIARQLEGRLPFSQIEQQAMFKNFRAQFTWQNCADQMMNTMERLLVTTGMILLDVTNACHDTANSGVMRVTRKVAAALQARMETIFVLWDKSIGSYVFPYAEELRTLCAYGGPDASKVIHQSEAGHPRSRLEDVIDTYRTRRKYHLFTETVSGAVLETVIPYLRAADIVVGAVFHDAIPVLHPELCSQQVAENHGRYMKALASCDIVMATAKHNEEDLKRYWQAQGIRAKAETATVSLAAAIENIPRVRDISGKENGEKEILFVSTIEPRKNHIRLLHAFCALMDHHPDWKHKVKLTMIGNRYAGREDLAKTVEDVCSQHENIEWLGVVSDEELYAHYQRCWFTVYPSVIEGFGMPIAESFWFGKPCLASDKGSIAELAGGHGGCLVDVHDEEVIEKALWRLLTDKVYYCDLCREALQAPIITWSQYAERVIDVLGRTSAGRSRAPYDFLPASARLFLSRYLDNSGKVADRPVIICSNYFPPAIVGGAEVIAYHQAKAMQQVYHRTVVVFSTETSGTKVPGNVCVEEYDGLPVVRVSVPALAFDMRGINFFDDSVNKIFSDLCLFLRPDIVHAHNITGLSIAILDIAKLNRAKTCLTLHDSWGYCVKNTTLNQDGLPCRQIFACENCLPELMLDGIRIPVGVRQSYIRYVMDRVDAFISPSRYLADAYIRAGYPYHKMHVVWNGIDWKRFASATHKDSPSLRISFVGHFGAHKGVDLLLEAVSLLKKQDIEINLVGGGEEREHYEQIAKKYGLEKQVRFWGKIENKEIEKVYAETDIYCLPSIWPENQPVSITEAMAAGVPVIASRIGGNSELVEDGETGYLFQPRNVRNLADKIEELYNHRDRMRAFGKAGQARMKGNSYEDNAKKLYAIYESIGATSYTIPRPLLIVKGHVLPVKMDQLTTKQVLLMDWVVTTQEYDRAAACILIAGEYFTETEIQILKEKQIPVFVARDVYRKYQEKGLRVHSYRSMEELMEAVTGEM